MPKIENYLIVKFQDSVLFVMISFGENINGRYIDQKSWGRVDFE